MARFDVGIVIPALIFLASFVGRSRVGSEKIDAKVDIVAMIAHGRMVQHTPHLKPAYKKLPTFFEVGPDKARLAVVAGVLEMQEAPRKYENFSWIFMNLSADSKRYERIIENYSSPFAKEAPGRLLYYYAFWGRTFDLIRTRIFQNVGSRDRAKVVVFIMFHSAHPTEDNEKAKTFREAGAWLYFVTSTDSNLRKGANEMAGNPNRVVLRNATEMDSSSSLVSAMDSIVEAIHRDLCQWDSACRYDGNERKQCQFESWMPSPHPYMYKVQQCGKFKPTNNTCDSLGDCEEECNKRWPWEEEPCEDKCGVNDGKRRGPAPPKMENCPQWIACPPCTGAERHGSGTKRSSTTSFPGGAVFQPSPKGHTKRTHKYTTFIVVGVVAAVFLIALIAVIIVLRKRAKRLMAPKIASVRAPSRSPLPVMKVIRGKKIYVATMSQRAADAAVAADISLRSPSSATVLRPKSILAAGNTSVKNTSAKIAAAESMRTVLKKSASKSVISKGWQ